MSVSYRCVSIPESVVEEVGGGNKWGHMMAALLREAPVRHGPDKWKQEVSKKAAVISAGQV